MIYYLLLILSKIPILDILISKLEPPYDRKGSVTPVTGINPTTTIKLSSAWKENWNVIPNAKYLANKLLVFKIILKQEMIIKRKSIETITTPKKPNSSDIIENIKSVCGSGK